LASVAVLSAGEVADVAVELTEDEGGGERALWEGNEHLPPLGALCGIKEDALD